MLIVHVHVRVKPDCVEAFKAAPDAGDASSGHAGQCKVFLGSVLVPASGAFTVGWDGSIRGRLGVDVGTILPYVEAGVAFANATSAAPGGTPSFNGTYTGWTVGAGVEFMLASQLSANLEYRYNNYGSQTFNTVPIAFTDSQIRVGLNYHF